MKRNKNQYKLPRNEQIQEDHDLHQLQGEDQSIERKNKRRRRKYSQNQNESSRIKWLLIAILLGLTYVYLQTDHKKSGKQLKQLIIQNENEKSQNEPNLKIQPTLFNKQASPLVEFSVNRKKITIKDLKTELGIIQQYSKNEMAQQYINEQINKILKQSRYYDIHSFINDPHIKEQATIILQHQSIKPQDKKNKKRPLLQISNSFQNLQVICSQMSYPPDRPKQMPEWEIYKSQTKQQIQLSYFYYTLDKHSSNKNYLQAEYFHLDQLYNIGIYGEQLPLCVVAVGKNNAKSLTKLYQSIRKQNYTNYHFVHIDDNSQDQTIQFANKYLQLKPELKQRTTLIKQNSQKNALYNRKYAIQKYCQKDQIVLDIDADDWLIGRQVFQLVNSIYQAGNMYRGKKEQIWAVYFSNIGYQGCCPHANAVGPINETLLETQSYRSQGKWRTTQLRTFLTKIYDKIDKSDFIDKLMLQQGQFYVQASDSFIHNAIIQMGGLKHTKIVDEFPYFYSSSPSKLNYPEAYYSQFVSQTLPPYNLLQSFSAAATRNNSYLIRKQIMDNVLKRQKDVVLIRNRLKQQILQLIKDQIKKRVQKANNP